MDRARDEAVRFALVEHHGPVIDRVGHELAGFLGSHSLGFPDFIISLDVLLELRRSRRIDRGDPGDVDALFFGHGLDLRPVANQSDLGELFFGDLGGRLNRPGLLAFGKDDAAGRRLRFFLETLEQGHG